MENKIVIRETIKDDAKLILSFIQGLADYENLSNEVVATVEDIEKTIFDNKQAEVVIAELNGKPVGFALFFGNYSTFLGKAGIYLEDLFVMPEARGYGIGKKILKYLAKLAVDRDCGRLEWCCLDWNKPSIDFYKSLGAVPMDEWTTYRLTGDSLKNMAK